MYGLVNRAIEGLVRSQFGHDAWETILEQAGVDEVGFVSMKSYPDALTYQMVGAASEVLQIPVPDLLRAFGRYWTEYVGQQGYGSLMSLEGRSLGAFLEDLDAMHTRVAIQMPELRPPSFKVQHLTPYHHRVQYISERDGLGAMVVGLLEGLLALKSLDGEVRWVARKDEGAPFDEFEVVEGPRAA